MDGDGLWENRLGARAPDAAAFQLCHDLHQFRPDPFNPMRCCMSCAHACWHAWAWTGVQPHPLHPGQVVRNVRCHAGTDDRAAGLHRRHVCDA